MPTAKTLDVLIPTYKRSSIVINAINSVLGQILDCCLQGKVNIIVCDDCSPEFTLSSFSHLLNNFSDFFFCYQNKVNLGMSRNIQKMIAESRSQSAMVLTDDDFLSPKSLPDIIAAIEKYLVPCNPHELSFGAIFTPRYSYYTWGELKCVLCQPFSEDTLISSSPTNVIQYSENAFILTGV